MRAPIPGYHRGWDAAVAFVNDNLAKRPDHWARTELAHWRSRASTPGHLRDDFGWGYRDGAMCTLANHLYLTDNLEGTG